MKRLIEGTYLAALGMMIIVSLPLAAHAVEGAETTNNVSGSLSDSATESGGSSSNTSATTQSLSSAYQFKREGIFGCNLNGAYASSVATMTASGTYVPVADAAVIANTGYLVYKECVLREVVDRESESVNTSLIKQNLLALTRGGRNGGPQWIQNITVDSTNAANQAVLNLYQKNGLDGIDATYKGTVATAVKDGYIKALDQANTLKCKYPGVLQRQTFGWDQILAVGSPSCTPISAYYNANAYVQSAAALAADDLRTQAAYGRGLLPGQVLDQYGQPMTVTPAAFVDAIGEQSMTSGFRRIENANDIGQMVGALFAGLGTQVLSNTQGLAGISQASANQPAYLDRLTAESSSGVRDAAVNATLNILFAAQAIETKYNNGINLKANALKDAANKVYGLEGRCWTEIFKKACVTAPSSDARTCDSADGSGNKLSLTATTSAAFARRRISAEILPLATSIDEQLTTSNNALKLLKQYIDGLTNTTSLDAQRVIIENVDTLVNSGSLHKQTDVDAIQVQLQALQNTLGDFPPTQTGILGNMYSQWVSGTANPGNPTDLNSGWCSYASPDTITMWQQYLQHH